MNNTPSQYCCSSNVAAVVLLLLYAFSPALGTVDQAKSPEPGFVANVGQWPAQVQARVQTNTMTAWITTDGITYDYFRRVKLDSDQVADNSLDNSLDKSEASAAWNSEPRYGLQGHVLRTRFGSEASQVVGQEQREHYSNFIFGSAADAHFAHVPTYDRFVQKSVIPGVDIVYMMQDGHLRYDLHVAPLADIRTLKFRIEGAEELGVSEDGILLVQTSLGEVRHQGLYAYQRINGQEQEIACQFTVQPGNVVGFDLAAYNPTLPLVIDPLVHSTILGGASQDDPNDIYVDDDGNAYVTGATNSADFPTTPGAYNESITGAEFDVFVFKLDVSGSQIWSTYIGHEFDDSGTGIHLNPDGEVVVTGWTASDQFPTTVGAYDITQNSSRDAFALILSDDGANLIASTFIGSAEFDESRALDVDRLGNVYICGYTRSRFFPSTGVFRGGERDAFVTKFSPDLSLLTWSTFLGGSGEETAVSIAVDADQSVFVGGSTNSLDFFFVNPWDDSPNGGRDAWVARVANDGQSLIFGTYFGGRMEETMGGLALDDIGDLYFCGTTFSNDLPVTANTFDPDYKGAGDAYYVKMLRDGSDVVYVSYLGAESADDSHDIAVTENREPVIYGVTRSIAFPVSDRACATDLSGFSDLFVTQMNSAGNRLLCSSFIGGKGENEFSRAIAIGPDGDFHLTGRTLDDEFPTSDFSESQGGADVFVTRFNCNPTSLAIDAGPDQLICFGDPATIGNIATGGQAGYTYRWEPEAGLSDPDVAQPTANPTVETRYTVFVTDAAGCRVVDHVLVEVRERLFADAGEDVEVCFGEDVTLGGAPTGTGGVGNLTYEWIPALNLDDPTLANPTVTISTVLPTTYFVTITDEQGCTTTDQIRVNFTEFPRVNPGDDRLLCANSVSRLGGSPTADGANGPYTYLWTPDTGLDDPTSPNPNIEFSSDQSEPINYILTVTDKNDCVTTASVEVRFNPFRVEDPPDLTVCPNEALQLGVSILGYNGDPNDLEYTWGPPSGLSATNTPNPTFTQNLPGSYPITVQVKDPNSVCEDIKSFFVNIPRQPSLAVSPLIVNFPPLGGCDNSAIERLSVRNSDGRAFEIKRIEFEGPFSLATPFTSTLLGDNQTLDLDIVYNPLAAGVDEGAIILILTDCEYEVSVQLRGRKTEAEVAISRTVLDFGTSVRCLDGAVQESVWIYNLGDGEVEIEASDASNPFEVSTFLPQRLAAGDSLEVVLRYSAWLSATLDATAQIAFPFRSEACSDTLKVNVFGRALAATLEASLARVDFPALSGCEQERDTSLVFSNTSEIEVELRRIDLEGDLSLDPPLPIVIPPGETREVRVRFRPSGEGDFSGLLDFQYGHCDSVLTVDFSGAKRGVTFGADIAVDLGSLVSCRDDILQSTFDLEYTGDADIDGEVLDVRVSGPFEQDLAVGTLLLRDGTPVTSAVRLDRTALGGARGLVTGSIFVRVSPCDIELEIALRAEILEAEIELSPASILDQDVILDPNAERVIEFVNSGTAAFELGTATLNPQGAFTILEVAPVLGTTIAPGESVFIRVRYAGAVTAQQTRLGLSSTVPCDLLEAEVIVRGRASDIIDPPPGRVRVSLNQLREDVGAVFDVIVTLESLEDLAASGAESYVMDLRFHRSMMTPLDPAFAGVFDGEDRVIQLSGTRPQETGVLHRLQMRSLWGYDSCAVIDIDTVLWTGGEVFSEDVPGSICLTDLCEAGKTTRLYLSGAPLAIRMRTAVPVRSAVLDFALEGLEAGKHSVYLLDIAGRRRFSILDQELSSERLDVQAPLSTVPNGAYILVVESPRLRLTRLLTIVR